MVRVRALLAAGALAAAVLAPAAAPGAQAADGPVTDRTIRDRRVAESSGLAVSPQHPGVLWTHGDSGNPPVLRAIGPDGAVAASLRLRGTSDVDWEAMAAFRDAGGRAVLAVADIGDNGARRASVEIVLVPEPATLRDATVSPSRVLTLRYPDGPRDAEAMLVDAEAGRMYLVTKGLGGALFQVPTDVWPGGAGTAPRSSGTLERIASVPLILVTDGVMGPGHHPVLRTYGDLAVLPPVTPQVTGGSLEPLAVAALPRQEQGEGLALTGDGQVLLSSEGVGRPLLRLPLPAPLAAVLTPGSGATAHASSAPGMPSGAGTAGSPHAARPDAARSDAARSDAARSDAARSDAARSDAARSDAAPSRGSGGGGLPAALLLGVGLVAAAAAVVGLRRR